MQAETITVRSDKGDDIEAYYARPMGDEPRGSVVVIHHMPGYDRATKEITRTFAVYGYAAICPNLFYRYAPDASPGDAAAAARAAGGVPDEQLIADVSGAAKFLRAQSASNGKVGVIGYCSGGRQTFLVACTPEVPVDAAVDCYGGRSPYEMSESLQCPLLGLFGADDQAPSPEYVAQMEAELTKHGKKFEFHTYEGAGHAFFSVDRPSYRLEAAKEGWKRIWAFFGEHLTTGA
jgi:carboxymethylenebutenolidase